MKSATHQQVTETALGIFQDWELVLWLFETRRNHLTVRKSDSNSHRVTGQVSDRNKPETDW